MPLARVIGTTLNYRFDGPEQGVVVMLCNSLATNLAMWDYQVPALVEAGFRVLRYDSRGHGESAVPAGPYSMEMLAGDAVSLLDSLGLEKVHFCGLSMGGMVGQILGARYGGRLLSLTLSSTSAYISPHELWDNRIESVRKHGMTAVVDATIERWFTEKGREHLAAEVEQIRSMILSTPVEGYCSCCAAIRDMDLRNVIQTISSRVLIIAGEHDPGTTVAVAQSIHDKIPSSNLWVVAGAAHLVNVEQSDVFNRMLLEFIKE